MISILFLIFALLVTPTFAQIDGFCGDLSAEDCDLYTSFETTTLPTSVALTADFALDAVAEGEAISFAFTANGAYIYDVASVTDYVDSLRDLPITDLSVGTVYNWLAAGIKAFNGELLINITASPEAGLPLEEIPVNLWIVDGVGYVDLAPYAMFDPTFDGVYGVDLFEVADFGLSQVTIGDLIDGLEDAGLNEAVMEGLDGGFDVEGEGNPFDMMMNNMSAQTISAEDAAAFVTIRREANETIDGVEVAVFISELDLASVFEVEAVRDQLIAQFEMQGTLPEGVSAEDFADALSASFSDDSSFLITEMYGIEDGYLYSTTLVLDLSIDPVPLAAVMGQEADASGASGAPVTVQMNFDIKRSDFNAVESIEVPADATVIPLEALIGAM